MNERNLDQLLDAWLDLGPKTAPDRVQAAVAMEIRSTRQASGWRRMLTERFVRMDTYAKVGIGIAALLLAWFGGSYLLSAGNFGGTGPSPSALASPSTRQSPSATPELPAATPDPHNADLPTDGRYRVAADGLGFSLVAPSSGWEPFAGVPFEIQLSKSFEGPQGAEALVYWTAYPEGDKAVPCSTIFNGPKVASIDDAANHVAAAGGTGLVAGPSDVRVDDHRAVRIVVTVREDVGCDPGYFYEWQMKVGGAFWRTTDVGDTIRVWVVDVDGTPFFIAAETKPADSGHIRDAMESEIQAIIDSIAFE